MFRYKIIITGLLLSLFMTACNQKLHTSTSSQTAQEENADFTTKSGESIVYPAVKEYPDIQPKSEGRMLTTQELANKICYCSYDLTRLNSDIKRYHRNNDKTSLERMKSKIDQAYIKFDRCMAEVKANYPKAVMENNPEAVMEEIKRQCSGLVELMDAGHKQIIRRFRKKQ